MQNGGTYSDWSRGDQRRDTIPLQKTQNGWAGWIWGTRDKHFDYKGGRCGSADVNDENLPKSDCLERSVLKRGVTRRAYQICVLETRYPCENPAHATESEKSGTREYKNYAIKSSGSFYGNKSIANSAKSVKEKEPCPKRVCRYNRRIVDDSICCRVFQALGNDLLVKFLTPHEVYNIETAFQWDFDWGRAWHGGKVKDKAVAARMQYDLQRGYKATFLLEKFDHNLAFSAFWYLLDVGEIIQLAHQYSHLKTIRKLCHFN